MANSLEPAKAAVLAKVQRTSTRPKIVVTADGRGVVDHAGTRLLVDLADATGLSAAMSDTLVSLRQRESGHDPGRVGLDLAVMLAAGGEAMCDLAVLRNQPDLFGPVASDPTAWRVLAALDDEALAGLQVARAQARELAWAQAAETGRAVSSTGGRACDSRSDARPGRHAGGASLKRRSRRPRRGEEFRLPPTAVFPRATGEALAGLLRPGNAGSNTAADHITVLDQALAQIPDAHRHGNDVLIRCDSAGASHAFLDHIRGLCELGVRSFFSVGGAITEPIRTAIVACVDWLPAIEADRELRDGAEIAELTHLVDLSAYPEGTCMIVRRERLRPGAQLSLFDTAEGLRHQAFITDTPRSHCSVQLLELRHRGHARVEDRNRTFRVPFALDGRNLRQVPSSQVEGHFYAYGTLNAALVTERPGLGIPRCSESSLSRPGEATAP